MHMRKTNAFTSEELAYLAGFPFITIEKTTGSGTYGSSEKGALAAAQGIKAINPAARVLYYRNVLVHYTNTYDVDSGLNLISKPFLEDASGEINLHQGIRPLFDLSNDSVQQWWVDHAVDMSKQEEIDGIFYDGIGKVISTYMASTVGTAKKQAVLEGYNRMMEACQTRMDPSKIKIGNLIRASFPNSGMDYLPQYDGSYLEGFMGTPGFLAAGIEAAQTVAREGKIICLTLGMDEILPGINELKEEGGYLLLPDSVQAVFDFYLSIFLTIAEEYSYFLIHDGYNAYSVMGNDRLWLKRFAEYDRPLGPPKGPAVQSGYIYTRQFENAAVYLDIGKGEGRINWGSDSIPYPPGQDPEPVKFSLQYQVREANSPAFVSGALIELDTLSYLTSDAGQQVFSLDSGSYQYTITKPGFFPLDSSIHLISDTTVQISMQSATANVKFRIRAGDSPLRDAEVLFDGNSLQSNQVGLAVFTDLPVFEEYSWKIGKEGYETVYGSCYLNQDTSINVQLTALTDLERIHAGLLRIYPLPADNYLVLESSGEMLAIQVVDLGGRLLLSESVTGREVRRELPEGMPHVCFLKVLFKDGTVISRKIFRH